MSEWNAYEHHATGYNEWKTDERTGRPTICGDALLLLNMPKCIGAVIYMSHMRAQDALCGCTWRSFTLLQDVPPKEIGSKANHFEIPLRTSDQEVLVYNWVKHCSRPYFFGIIVVPNSSTYGVHPSPRISQFALITKRDWPPVPEG